MTHQKSWVLNAHTRTDKINIFVKIFVRLLTNGVSDDKEITFFMDFRKKKRTIVAMSQINMNRQAWSIALGNMFYRDTQASVMHISRERALAAI